MQVSLVSVIIPVFNASRFIQNAVNAVTQQSYANLEIIVVDDGSTDDSAEIIKSIGDSRVRYVFQSNQGQSAAINRGVEESNGAYIKVMDADDWINSEHIACQIAALEGRTDCVSSCRWGYFVDDFQSPSVRTEVTGRSYDDPIEWIVDSLTQDEGMMGGWVWLIPRGVWDNAGGYDAQLSLNNDFHFSIATLLAANGVRFAEGAVYSYRKGVSGALSASYGPKAMHSAFLTTDLGTRLLLVREDSERIRRIAADRFQAWLFQFYPQFPDLVTAAEARILELGGSALQMNGGHLCQLLKLIIGWKGVRQLQSMAYRVGWRKILHLKSKQRMNAFR